MSGGRLERQWDRGDDVPTDNLREVFQRYRSSFDGFWQPDVSRGDVTPVRAAALLGENVAAVGTLWGQAAGRSKRGR